MNGHHQWPLLGVVAPKVPRGWHDSRPQLGPGQRRENGGTWAWCQPSLPKGVGNQKGGAPEGQRGWRLRTGPQGTAHASPPPGGRSCRGVAWVPHTLASGSSFIGAGRSPPGKARDTARRKPSSSREVGGATGTRSAQPAAARAGHTDPHSSKGKAAADRRLRRAGSRRRCPDSARDSMESGGPKSLFQAGGGAWLRGTHRGRPLPPVPSVGHNNLKDMIDILTLYNNIS